MSLLWPVRESTYQTVPPKSESRRREVGTAIANRRTHRDHAMEFRVRRASLEAGFFARVQSIQARISEVRLFGTEIAQASAEQSWARASVSIVTRFFRRRRVSFFSPLPKCLVARFSVVRRACATAVHPLLSSAPCSTALR